MTSSAGKRTVAAAAKRAGVAARDGVRGEHAHVGVLVLGMHRSGTSAITRVLNLLGVDIGDRLMTPQAGVNEKGFWEHVGAVAIHERLLHWHDSNWSDIRALPPIDAGHGVGQQAADDIRGLIRRDFGAAALWAVKDPRMSLFLPIWLHAMAAENVDPRVIITVRHPEEVAASLEKRDGLTRGHAFLLWGRHVVEAVRSSAGLPRAVVDYSELLRDWRSQVDRVADVLSLTWPKSLEAAAGEIDRFLNDDDRHHRSADRPAPSADPLQRCVDDMYDALLGIARGGDGWDSLQQVCARFEKVSDGLVPHVSELLKQVWMHAERADHAEGSLDREAALRMELGGKENRVAELEKAVAEWTAKAESLADSRAELELRVRAIEAGTEVLSAEVRARDGRIDALQQVLAEKEVRLQAAAEEKQHLETWLENVRLHAGNLEARVGETDAGLKQAQLRSEALAAQLAERDARLGALEQWLADKDKRLEEIEMELSDRNAAIGALRSQAKDLEDRCAALGAENAAIEGLRSQAKDLEDRCAALRAENAAIEGLRSQAKDLEDRCAALRAENAAIEGLRSQAKDLEDRCAALHGEHQRATARAEALDLQLAERDAGIADRERRIAENEQRLEAAAQALRERDAALDALQQRSAALADNAVVVAGRLAESERELREMLSSRTWRYTSIFRRRQAK